MTTEYLQELGQERVKRMVRDIIAQVSIKDLMSEPSLFTMEENLIIRKMKELIKDREKKRRKLALLTGKEIKPRNNVRSLELTNKVELIKVKYALLKNLISVTQAQEAMASIEKVTVHKPAIAVTLH